MLLVIMFQQAPPVSLHSAAGPIHVAFTTAQVKIRDTANQIKYNEMIVTNELAGLLNRFLLNQRIILRPIAGGFISAILEITYDSFMSYLDICIVFRLYQFIKADVIKLSSRYTNIIKATPSIAWPV